MKKIKFIWWSAFLAFSLLMLTGRGQIVKNTTVFEPPKLIHLSLADKKSTEGPPGMIVTWCSEKAPGPQYVRYGITPDLEKVVKADLRDFHEETLLRGTLKDLEFNSKYFYKCGSDDSGWSPLYTFITEPDNNSNTTFRVGVFGDTQNNNLNEEFQKTRGISDLIQTYSPNLTLYMNVIIS